MGDDPTAQIQAWLDRRYARRRIVFEREAKERQRKQEASARTQEARMAAKRALVAKKEES